MAVGGRSKGEVGKREEQAALNVAASIMMARLYGHFCAGIALTHINKFNAVSPRKLIAQKELFNLFYIQFSILALLTFVTTRQYKQA